MSRFRHTARPFTGVDGRALTLEVWQPVQGHAKALPMLLLLDGQWLHGTIDEALAASTDPAPLVASLGFSSAEREVIRPWRARDYTPRAPGAGQCDPRVPQWRCGGADTLLDLIGARLLPQLVAEHHADPARCALFGHSYAGLFAIYAWLQQPTLFNPVYAASPSLWWYWPHVQALASAALAAPRAQALPALHLFVGDEERWRPIPAQAGQPRPPGIPTLGFARRFLGGLAPDATAVTTLEVVPGLAHGPMLAWSARHCLQHFAASMVQVAAGRP